MASITDRPPKAVQKDLKLLRRELDEQLPPKCVDRNLLVATWNLRHLFRFTPEWHAKPPQGSGQKVGRDLGSLLTIAEIMSRFDVVAIQELRGDCDAMRPIMECLGPHWSLMLTDMNVVKWGNNERLGFVFDTRRVRLTGLAGEIAIDGSGAPSEQGADSEQFARAPYVAGFESLGRVFTLVAVHTVFGGRDGEARARGEAELNKLARWMKRWRDRGSAWERNMIALGDANIDDEHGTLFKAFASTGLVVADDLLAAPRLTHWPEHHRLYSQIAWFTGDDGSPALPFDYRGGGSFDFGEVALASRNLERRQVANVISDHLPLWAEFTLTPRPDDQPKPAASEKPHITGPRPTKVASDLAGLETQLDHDVPAKSLDRNLLICTWNIRNFGNLTQKWAAGKSDKLKRDLHGVAAIAAILRRFDVIAVQEAKANLRALRATMELLGPEWNLMLTDVTKGDPGNDERMGFLFDTRRIALSGLACELVVPQEELEKQDDDSLAEQFARTPYAVGFRCLDTTFTLVSLHVLWGKGEKARVPELKAIANWLRDWARDRNAWDHNLIVLGDLNIPGRDDELYEAFVSTGLHIPEEFDSFPRTITSKKKTLYDQIAWFDGTSDAPALGLEYASCGYFDFTKSALKSRKLSRRSLSWVVSDHYPLWVEFNVRRM